MTQAPEVPDGTHLDADASDAELISRVRGGDVDAYGGLFERHRAAALRLARQLLPGPDADDLVSEAFAKVLNVLLAGGGPDVALRPYLLTAVRRLHVDKIRATKRAMPTDDLTPYDPGVPFSDTVISGFEGGAAAQAFASLPERWQLVLWHLEVEGQKPADIAPMLGMSPNSVSALAYRAREGLRQAFLQMHTADLVEDDCRWTHDKLGAYVRKGLSRRDNVKVEAHLDGCRKCTAILLELDELNSELAALIGPVVLGSATATYLAAGSTTAGVVKGGVLLGFVGKAKQTAKNPAVAAAAVLAMLLAGVGGFALVHGGGGNQPPAASKPPAATTPAPPASSSPKTTPKTTPKTPPKPAAPAPSAPSPTTAPPTVPVVAPVDRVAPSAPTHLRLITSTARVGGLRAMATGVTSVRAAWDRSRDNTGVTGYEIYANGRRIATVHGTGYSFSHLQHGTRYTVWVVARDAAGNVSARSNTVSFTTAPAPGRPQDTTPPVMGAITATATPTTLAFRWSATDDVRVDHYTVSFDGARPVTTTATAMTFTGLQPGTPHHVTVTAYDAAGNRAARSRTAATQPAPPPVDTTPPVVTVTVDAEAHTFTWSATDDVQLASVTVTLDGNPVSTENSVVPIPTDPGDHTLLVVATDEAGNVAQQSKTVTVPETSSVQWHWKPDGKSGKGNIELTVQGASLVHPVHVQVALSAGSFDNVPPGCLAIGQAATCVFTSDVTASPVRVEGLPDGSDTAITVSSLDAAVTEIP